LTVLLVALLSSWGVSLSTPASPFSTARSAEASNAILLIAGGPSPFGEQFVDQGAARFHMLADKTLRPLEAAFQSRDSQLVILDSQRNLIAGVNAKRLTKRSRDDHPAVFINTRPGLSLNCHILHNMT
jgi:hypothetical protein